MNQNTMMLVSPAAVKHYRKKRGMTQAQLADIEDEHKLTRKTINAIENSNEEGKKVHRAIYDSLLSRLKITPNQIIGNELDENQSDESEVFSGNSLKAWINDEDFLTRDKITSSLENNYKKVCETYNANITDILCLAPLLFSQFAEKCANKEIRKFSDKEDINNKKQTKYVLKYYLRDFFFGKDSGKPRNIQNQEIVFGKALAFYKKKGKNISWFSSPMDVKKLINNIYLSLRQKDVFFREIKNVTDSKTVINPMKGYIIKILNKKNIRETFGLVKRHEKHRNFEYSKIVEYRLLEDIKQLEDEEDFDGKKEKFLRERHFLNQLRDRDRDRDRKILEKHRPRKLKKEREKNELL